MVRGRVVFRRFQKVCLANNEGLVVKRHCRGRVVAQSPERGDYDTCVRWHPRKGAVPRVSWVPSHALQPAE